MKSFVLITESFFYFVCLQLISYKILESRKLKKSACLGMLLLYCVLIYIGVFFEYDVFIFAHALLQIIQIFATKLMWKKLNFFTVLGFYSLLYFFNVIFLIALECIFSFSENQSFLVEFILHVFMLVFCILCCFVNKLCIGIKQIVQVLPLKIKFLTILSLTVSALIMNLIMSIPFLQEATTFNITMRVFLVLFILIISLAIPILIITVLMNSYLKNQNENFEKELQAQAKHYEDISKANYELRRFRHDFNNIKIGLTKLLDDNNYQTALSMLQNTDSAMKNESGIVFQFDTGNGIVDAILVEKQIKAKDSNTSIIFNGSVPLNSLSPVDLCVIFGNTLDNAIEACEKLPRQTEKTIYISSQCNSGFIFISIENPVAEAVKIKDNFISTTKKDSSLHGYGLYSLNKIAKKYTGNLKLSCENHVFKMEIDLCVNNFSMA